MPLKPNLHLASMDELLEEIDKRKEKEEENKEDDDEENEADKVKKFTRDPMDIPERLAIIGGGPAVDAAIYAARAGYPRSCCTS